MSRTVPSFAEEGLKRFLHGMDRRIKDLERGGSWRFDAEFDPADADVTLRNAPQLLCMAATNDSVASGGDYLTFTSILDQHGFTDVVAAGSSFTHTSGGVYTLTYEHAWTSYEGGGTIELELDGITTMARRIGTGTAWRLGRGTIHYKVEAGQVGRIKVTQSSGSGETCNATMWLSISDPLQDVAVHSAELYLNDELVSWTDETLTANHSGATTLLVGELSASPAAASDMTYDDVSVVHTGELIGNGGFEAAVAGSGTSKAVSTGNWRIYDPGSGSGTVVGSPVHAGAGALKVVAAAGSPNACYAIQDLTLPEGDAFQVEFWVYPTSGAQFFELAFDWDRSSGAAQTVAIVMSASSVTCDLFGVSLPATAGLALGQWSNVRLVVPAQEV